MKPKRRRHNKQTPFYAFTEDGKVYAANRKAKRIAYAQRAIVKPEPLTENNNTTTIETEPKLLFEGVGLETTQKEDNANDNGTGV